MLHLDLYSSMYSQNIETKVCRRRRLGSSRAGAHGHEEEARDHDWMFTVANQTMSSQAEANSLYKMALGAHDCFLTVVNRS